MVFGEEETIDYPDGYDEIPISENESITVRGDTTYRAVRVVGISEPTIYTNILLSPNPANSTTTLSLDLEKAGNLQITLTNITGQEVLQLYNSFADIGAFTKVFSVADLPSGTYFIRMQLGDNTKYEKLIVK